MNVRDSEKFRANLAALLELLDVSQRAFATRFGTQHPYISNVLAGKVSPSLDQCEKFAAVCQALIEEEGLHEELQIGLETLLMPPENFKCQLEKILETVS